MRTSKSVIATVLVLASSTAFADKLDDFKRARSETGCKSIPYSDLRSNCNSQQGPVHDWCDGGKGPVSCGSEGTSRRLKEALEKEKKNNEALKQKKRDLEGKRSRSSDESEKSKLSSEIEATEKEIYESGKAIDKANDHLRKRKELVNHAIYSIGKCLDYRRAVMNVFASAQDKVRTEDETPEIEKIARELRDMYEESKRGHKIAITDKDNALSTCKKETL
jgi:hypothetical protein